jgi:hypothetical protein
MSFVPLARYWDGRYEDGARLAREALEFRTEISSVYVSLFSVANLALNLTGLSRFEEAFEWFERGAAMGREWEVKHIWTGRTINMHANALREVGSLEAARVMNLEGLEGGIEAGFPRRRSARGSTSRWQICWTARSDAPSGRCPSSSRPSRAPTAGTSGCRPAG